MFEEDLLAELDETAEVRERGRSAVLRELASDFLRRRREREIDAQWWQRPETEPGQRSESEPPPAGVEAAIVASSESLSLPRRRGGRRAVGNAKRFPRGVGGCRAVGGGTAAFHTPAAPPAGEMGVPGEEGEISAGSGPGGGSDRRQGRLRRLASLPARAVRAAPRGQDVGVVREAVQQRRGQLLVPEDLHPLAERQVRRHNRRARLVAL